MSADQFLHATIDEVLPGYAAGPALVLAEPLSFWGGLDPTTGRIIDQNHPDCGALVTDTVLCLPAGRGSSSASSVIAESVRLGTAPAAVVLGEIDEIIAVGIFVASELYDLAPPLGVLRRSIFARLETGMTIEISDGSLTARQ